MSELLAPPEWYYHGFPLAAPDEESVALDEVVRHALRLVALAEASGDHTHLGMVPHWAHLLKIEQSAHGDWPAVVNARTGEAIGCLRTLAPLELFARLGHLLQSTEFDEALARIA